METIDVNGRTLEGPVPLEVIVIDQNDNRPIFREGPYIGHVMEGSPTGMLPWLTVRIMAWEVASCDLWGFWRLFYCRSDLLLVSINTDILFPWIAARAGKLQLRTWLACCKLGTCLPLCPKVILQGGPTSQSPMYGWCRTTCKYLAHPCEGPRLSLWYSGTLKKIKVPTASSSVISLHKCLLIRTIWGKWVGLFFPFP